MIDIKNYGTGIKYYTQGDSNPNLDEGYREREDIIGKVKIRIPYIGDLSLMINELFEQSDKTED